MAIISETVLWTRRMYYFEALSLEIDFFFRFATKNNFQLKVCLHNENIGPESNRIKSRGKKTIENENEKKKRV